MDNGALYHPDISHLKRPSNRENEKIACPLRITSTGRGFGVCDMWEKRAEKNVAAGQCTNGYIGGSSVSFL